jgi:hypothetical protein
VEASFPIEIEGRADMHRFDFWSNHGEAMEMSIEGNRLVSREIASWAGQLYRRMIRSFDGLRQGDEGSRHSPPF